MCAEISRDRRTMRAKSQGGACPEWSGSAAKPVRRVDI
jgi:hypothetical protein